MTKYEKEKEQLIDTLSYVVGITRSNYRIVKNTWSAPRPIAVFDKRKGRRELLQYESAVRATGIFVEKPYTPGVRTIVCYLSKAEEEKC